MFSAKHFQRNIRREFVNFNVKIQVIPRKRVAIWQFRRIASVVGTDCTGVSLTHVAIYACIIINGSRVGVVRTHVSEQSAAYICATRGQRCVIALPIEFSYTGMASLMHKMTGPNSVIVRFTKRIRPRVVNIARRCERRCHIVTTEFSGARK